MTSEQLDLSRSFKCCAGFTGEEYTAITYESICNCGICFGKAKDAVTTKCGHLFCWPCLHQWLETNPNVCPKCRTVLNQTDYFAFYACGAIEHEDRQDFPPRPTVQRLEPEIDVDQHENWSTEANLSDVEHEDWSTEANLSDVEHENRRNYVLSWLTDQRSEPAEAYLSDAEHEDRNEVPPRPIYEPRQEANRIDVEDRNEVPPRPIYEPRQEANRIDVEDRHNESSPRPATFTFFLTAFLIIATIVMICVIVIAKSSDYFILESGENEKHNKKRKRINIERTEISEKIAKTHI